MKLNFISRSIRMLFLVVGLAVLGVACWQGPRPSEIVIIHTYDYPQAVVDAHPEGTVFFFEPGIYYNVHITPKNGQVFAGAADGEVILNGSGSSLAAFNGNRLVQDVIIANMAITNYAPGPFDAVIDAASQNWTGPSEWNTPTNWAVSNVHLYGNYGSGESAAIEVGSGSVVVDNVIEDNGGLGIFGHGYGIKIENNRIENNASSASDVFDHSGGIKLVIVHDSDVINNEVNDNNGVGIWFDINSDYNRIDGNSVSGNSLAGIQYELSRNGTITNNYLSNNAWGDYRGWLLQSSIFISTSNNNVIEDNVIENAPGGVTVVDQRTLRNMSGGQWTMPQFGRMYDNGNIAQWRSENNQVRNNTFTNAGNTGASATNWESSDSNVYSTTTFSGNSFNGNNSRWWGYGTNFANPVSVGEWASAGNQ